MCVIVRSSFVVCVPGRRYRWHTPVVELKREGGGREKQPWAHFSFLFFFLSRIVTFSFLSKEKTTNEKKKFNCLTVAVRFHFHFFFFFMFLLISFLKEKQKIVSHIFILFASYSVVKSVGYYVSSETVTHARTQEKKLTQSFVLTIFSLFAPPPLPFWNILLPNSERKNIYFLKIRK